MEAEQTKENGQILVDKQKLYPTWEILALIIGFVGSANLVPELINLLFDFYANIQEAPRSFKLICIGIYLLILIVMASRHLYGIHVQHSESKENDESKFKRIYRRLQILNFIRQFPLSLFNYIIFSTYKVFSYDLFTRYGDWVDRPDLFNLIGRFRIKGKTIELQYPKNFKYLLVRETIEGSDKFGDTKEVIWTQAPNRFLSATSWLGFGWTIAHLNYQFKLFSKIILMLSFAYFIGFVLHLLDILNLRLQFSGMDTIWKAWIVLLLILDLLASIGLFRKKAWGELVFLFVAVAQIVVYTQFRSKFGEQEFLVMFHFVSIGVYGVLKILEVWRKTGETTLLSGSINDV